MTGISHARELLLDALRQYSAAGNEAEIEQSVLALHTGLDEAFRAYLASEGYDEVGHLEVNFPELVDLIRDYTDLFEGDPRLPRLLTALNATRIKIAHPRGDKPSPQQIANDAEQFARLARRFWQGLFGERCPVSVVVPYPKPVARPSQPLEPPPVEPGAQRSPPSSKLVRVLRPLWRDEIEPRFQSRLFLKRLIAIAILFTLAKWCKDGAISTARWPEPVKYGGIALFLVAVGLFLWGIVTIWKILQQLRLRGLLIVLGVGYLLLISTLVLTSGSPLPLHQEALLTTKRLIVAAGRKTRDVGQTLVETPGEFRLAYTGHHRPILLASMDPEDTSYLTPIPANRPAQLSLTAELTASPTRAPVMIQESTPTPSSVPATVVIALLPPDCPHTQARLTAPRVNQAVKDEVQVEGTANIENFDYYKFEIRREDGDVEDEWHWVESFETPVEEGVLGTWYVSHLPAGIYTFRLTVVNREGNYPFPPCDVRVHVTH